MPASRRSQEIERRSYARQRIVRRRRTVCWVVLGLIALITAVCIGTSGHRTLSAAQIARIDIEHAAAISPLRGRVVRIAEGEVGYRSDPASTYCNKYSAYWVSGTDDCGNGNLGEQWCADFAAWVWHKAGASVVYGYVRGDLNASSASFYEWGVAHGTWHSLGSGYLPKPGDVAVYGLDTSSLVAQHDAVVVAVHPGHRGPDAVNGDGDRTGFSVVEVANDEYQADISPTKAAQLSGYVSPP